MNKNFIVTAGIFASILSFNANAIAVDINTAAFEHTFNQAEGRFSSTLNSAGNYGYYTSSFFNAPIYAAAIEYFDTVGTTLHFTGTSLQGDYDYDFVLSEGDIAWGVYVDWSVNYEIPQVYAVNCGVNPLPGDICNSVFLSGTVVQVGPFPGGTTGLTGIVSAVPIPASVWLFSLGLIGLIGIAKGKVRV